MRARRSTTPTDRQAQPESRRANPAGLLLPPVGSAVRLEGQTRAHALWQLAYVALCVVYAEFALFLLWRW